MSSIVSTSDLTIAIVGATGAVGEISLGLLKARNHPAANIVAMASARSAGKTLAYGDETLTVVEATPAAFEGVDIAFISASADVSRALAPEAVKRGVLVIDDGSAFRMDPKVPLVVPEINGADVEWHSGIISIPNCTTTPLAMVLDVLNRVSPITAVTVSTYQAVTGTGAAARVELIEQSKAMLAGGSYPPSEYPHEIAFNVLPHVDSFTDNGYTKEEIKMLNESRKILHLPDLPLSATCVRVPVTVTHSESVQIEFSDEISAEAARSALEAAAGITVVDDPLQNQYPMPRQAEGRDDVLVGRIRKDLAHAKGIALWLACDNLRKGAALNALQIMDEAVKRGCVKPASAA